MIMSPTLAWFRPPDALLVQRGTVEAMITGAAVELSDQLAGGCEQDRVESGRPVRNPSGEGILGDLGEITDMNTAMIKIEPKRLRFAFSEGE
jgi:hypothetical protein